MSFMYCAEMQNAVLKCTRNELEEYRDLLTKQATTGGLIVGVAGLITCAIAGGVGTLLGVVFGGIGVGMSIDGLISGDSESETIIQNILDNDSYQSKNNFEINVKINVEYNTLSDYLQKKPKKMEIFKVVELKRAY